MSQNLKTHMMTNTGENLYLLKQCDKTFPSTDKLEGHILIHTDEKLYQCDLCD